MRDNAPVEHCAAEVYDENEKAAVASDQHDSLYGRYL
jgi:hypothetical protein